MDRAPTTKPNIASRLIAMAVSLLGDPLKVQQHIGCSEQDFQAYCAGEKELPWSELDKLISLITHEQGILIAQNREFIASIRSKFAELVPRRRN